MNEDILKKIEEQGEKIEKMYRSLEKIRRFFFWTFILGIALVILPLLGLLFVIPDFLDIYTGTLGM